MIPRIMTGWVIAALFVSIARRRQADRVAARHATACHLVEIARMHRLYSEDERGA